MYPDMKQLQRLYPCQSAGMEETQRGEVDATLKLALLGKNLSQCNWRLHGERKKDYVMYYYHLCILSLENKRFFYSPDIPLDGERSE